MLNKNRERGVKAILLAVAATAALGASGAQGASMTWDGGPTGTSTDWGTAANWRPDVAPTALDTVQFNAKDSVTNTSSTTTAGSMVVSVPYIGTGALQVGQTISGTGIPAGSVITSIVNSTTVTISQPATATATNVAVTVANTGGYTGTNTISLGAPQSIYMLNLPSYCGVPNLTIGSSADIAAGNTITLTNVYRGDNNSNTQTFAANVILAGDSNWNIVNGYNGSIAVTGSIGSNSAVTLTKVGSNTLTCSCSNTFTGNVRVLGGSLTLGNTNAYAGTTTASGGTLVLDFANSPTANIVNSSSSLVLGGVSGGGGVTMTSKNQALVANSQTFNGTAIKAGASSLSLGNRHTSGSMLANLGAITHYTGGTVNFTQPTGNTFLSATNGYVTSTGNVNGILGAWATVAGTNWATNDGTNIVAYTGYTDLAGATPSIADGSGSNVRINNGSSGDVGLAGTGTTNINTLLVNDAAARNINIGSGNTLRFGATGGILIPSGAGIVTLGASGNGGTLTAGSANNTPGELIITVNNSTSNAAISNAVIADNGSGAVALSKSGSGNLTLTAASTFTGGLVVNAGTLTLPNLTNPLATNGAITVTGGTLNLGGSSQTTSAYVAVHGGTVSNGTLTSSTSNFDVRGGTITAALAGSVGLVKTTSGTTSLSANNLYTGTTYVVEGTINATTNGATKGDVIVGSINGGPSASFSGSDNVSSIASNRNAIVYSNGSFRLGNGTRMANVTVVGGVFNSNYGYIDGAITLTGGTLAGPIYGNHSAIYVNASNVTSYMTGNNSMANANTFVVADGAAAIDLLVSGSITGSTSITKSGKGLMVLTNGCSYTGTTSVMGGTLRLDLTNLSAPASNMISAGSPLTMGNGKLEIVGKDATANSQAFASLAVTSGYNVISASSGTNGTTNIALGSTLSRSSGGTINFGLPTNGSITTTATMNMSNGVLVSAATNGTAFATVNGTDWATLDTGTIKAISSYNVDDFSTASNNVDVTTDQSPATFTVNTLRFNTAGKTLTLTGTNSVSTGGILVSSAGTNVTLAGNSIQVSGGSELVVINNGTLNISAAITDSNKSLTLAGSGTTTLSGSNSYKDTNIYSGVVIATNANSFGTTGNVNLCGGTLQAGSALTLARQVSIVNDSTIGGSNDITLNGNFLGGGGVSRTVTINNSGLTTVNGVTRLSNSGTAATFTINGTGTVVLSGIVYGGSSANPAGSNLVYSGSGALTLANSGNNYTGYTSVLGGTVNVTSLTNEAISASTTTVNGTNTLTLSAATLADMKTAGIGVGAAVSGTGIAANTTITDITGTTVTLSLNATASGTNSLMYGSATTSSIGQSTAAAANVIIDGGTLKYTGTGSSTNRLFSIGYSSGTLDASGTGAVVFSNTGAIGFNGVTGTRTLNLTGTSTAANTLAAAITDSVIDPTSLVKKGTGTWVLTGANTYTGGTTVSDGILEMKSLVTVGNNTLTGGTLKLTAGTQNHNLTTLASSNLTLGSGKLDLTNNDLLLTGGNGRELDVNKALAAPVAGTNPLTTVTTGVLTGQQWADLNGGDFHGQNVTGALVLRYTYAGDANLDGQVTMDDYLQIDTGYLFDQKGWAYGDFNHDGLVNAADYALIDNNFAQQAGVKLAEDMIQMHAAWFGAEYTQALESLQAVPEPASLALLAVGALGLLSRRKR